MNQQNALGVWLDALEVFEKGEQPLFKPSDVFKPGFDYYKGLITEMQNEFKSDMDRIAGEIDLFERFKQDEIETLKKNRAEGDYINKNRFLLRAAAKTLRRIPQFGNTENENDYEFPTKEDLEDMPTDRPVELESLMWKKNSTNANHIGALQVVLSNGVKSEVFLGKT